MTPSKVAQYNAPFSKMLDRFVVLVAFFESIGNVLMFPVMVSGVFQFSHSFLDRLTRQDKPHPHCLYIQFH